MDITGFFHWLADIVAGALMALSITSPTPLPSPTPIETPVVASVSATTAPSTTPKIVKTPAPTPSSIQEAIVQLQDLKKELEAWTPTPTPQIIYVNIPTPQVVYVTVTPTPIPEPTPIPTPSPILVLLDKTITGSRSYLYPETDFVRSDIVSSEFLHFNYAGQWAYWESDDGISTKSYSTFLYYDNGTGGSDSYVKLPNFGSRYVKFRFFMSGIGLKDKVQLKAGIYTQ